MKTGYKRKPKFTPGAVITSPQQVMDALKTGQWIYFGPSAKSAVWFPGRVYHSAWIANMNFACVCGYVAHRQLRLANRNPEYPYVFKARYVEYRTPEKSGEWSMTCSEIPGAYVTSLTKTAAAECCAEAVRKHTGRTDSRFQIHFISDTRDCTPQKLLGPAVVP